VCGWLWAMPRLLGRVEVKRCRGWSARSLEQA
jgi:hypothetical protein